MNKLDKKVMELYIKKNKTKEFVDKNPSYQEILYFAKHSNKNDLTLLTDYVIKLNDLDLVIDYAMYAKTITLKETTKIVHFVLSSRKASYISRLARHVPDLTEGNISLLAKCIAITNDYNEIVNISEGILNKETLIDNVDRAN